MFKTVPIDRRHAPIHVLPRRMMDTQRLNRAMVLWGATANDAQTITVEEWLLRSATDGLIVLHEGWIVAEQYFGQTTPATLRDLYSATKGFLTSILAPFLDNQTIDARAQVTDYIPEFATTGFAGATVRHLLDQTTGITATFPPASWLKQQPLDVQKEWVWASAEMRRADNELAQQFRAAGRFPRLPSEPDDAGFFDYLLTLRPEDAHGSYFNYSAANAGALQVVLERTTGVTYFEHLSNLWRDLGAESSATLMSDGAGCAASQSGMYCTLRDWARWGQMLCNDGSVGSGQILPGIAGFVADIQGNPHPELWTEKSALKDGFLPGMGYRNHLFTFPTQNGRPPILASMGAYHQNCVID
ncbi:MAG: serine hydrolase domain-containing protein [Pirellulaceae bacterium]